MSHKSLDSHPSGTIVVIVQMVSPFRRNVQGQKSKLKQLSELQLFVTLDYPDLVTLSLATSDNGRNCLWCTFFTVEVAESNR